MSIQDDSRKASLTDQIARLSIDTYTKLPAKCKPVIRSNGVPEWTILAAIVLAIPTVSDECSAQSTLAPMHGSTSRDVHADPEYELQIVSLGTGMKCLSYNRLPPAGDTLHDQHAEVLARRGFRRWLLDQARAVKAKAEMGEDVRGGVMQVSKDGEIGLREGVRVWMYVSTLPLIPPSSCGDASTTYTAAYQPIDMANLKSSPSAHSSTAASALPGSAIDAPSDSINTSSSSFSNSPIHGLPSDPAPQPTPLARNPQNLMRGRNNYTRTSSLRTKPGRPDSFPSISLSCSDKICSWSVVGLQGALLSNVRIGVSVPLQAQGETVRRERQEWRFRPVYLHGMVVGDVVPPGREMEGRLVGWQAKEGGREGKEGADGVDEWEEKLRTFREAVRADAEWALYGRVQSVADHLPAPYRVTQPVVAFTSLPFPYSRLALSPAQSTLTTSNTEAKEPAPMMNSLLHIPPSRCDPGVTEVLYQGADARQLWKPPGIIPLPEKRRSKVCKVEMMRAILRLSGVEVKEEVTAKAGRCAMDESGRRGEGVSGRGRGRGLQADMARISIDAGDDVSGGDAREKRDEGGNQERWDVVTYRQLKRSIFYTDFPANTRAHSAPAAATHSASSACEYPPSAQSYDGRSNDSLNPCIHLDEQPSPYQTAKRILRGIPSPSALVPGFERCGPLSVTGPYEEAEAGETKERRGLVRPFVGWIATGPEWEAFDASGCGVSRGA